MRRLIHMCNLHVRVKQPPRPLAASTSSSPAGACPAGADSCPAGCPEIREAPDPDTSRLFENGLRCCPRARRWTEMMGATRCWRAGGMAGMGLPLLLLNSV